MRISDLILESFDSDIQGKLVRSTPDHFTTQAMIGNRRIVFNASSHEAGMDIMPSTVWEIEFTERKDGNMTYGKSGSGNEMQVFSFVIMSIKELVARYKPDELMFGSAKDDSNRTGLYKRLINRIKLPGYRAAPPDSTGYTDVFRIVRDDK